MELKPLFKHPVGASEHCSDLSTFSENAPEVISCQLCGTKYLKYKDDCDYSDCYFNFLGYRGLYNAAENSWTFFISNGAKYFSRERFQELWRTLFQKGM